MKLVKSSTENLVRRLSSDGLFQADLQYKATNATGEMDYKGPKIPHEVWHQVLSFFRWTYDTTKSESQVRLFVSPRLGTWKAWAFPQQAEMGLTTKELSTDESKKQRAELFENHDDWIAWGTVHHHCDISAFQSGTDERDEANVSGLHITVGDMNKATHSFHARLYHQGDLYEVDMSKFWDVGDELSLLPPSLRVLLPSNVDDTLARSQMCQPSDVPFPDQWKANLIKMERTPTVYGGTSYDYRTQGAWAGNGQTYLGRIKRSAKAVDEILMALAPTCFQEQEAIDEIMDACDAMVGEEPICTILEAMKEFNIDLEDIMDEMRRRAEAPEIKADQTKMNNPLTDDDYNGYCQ